MDDDLRLIEKIISVIEIEKMEKGRSFFTTLVDLSNKKYFVKICKNDIRLNRLFNEYNWLKKLYSLNKNIVPKPLAYRAFNDADIKGMLVVEALDVANSTMYFTLEYKYEKFGEILAKLHNIQIRSQMIQFDCENWPNWKEFILGSIKKYIEQIKNLSQMPFIFEDKILKIFEIYNKNIPVCFWGVIHGDPMIDNFIICRDGSMKLIDLELMHYGDPLMDIAIIQLFSSKRNEEGYVDHFLHGYNAKFTPEQRHLIKLYKLARQLRSIRGTLWIYRDSLQYECEMQFLKELIDKEWKE